MSARILSALFVCVIALAIGAGSASADNQVTITYPVDGTTYSGPGGNNPFTAAWASTVNFTEDVNITMAYPECFVSNYDGDGVAEGWGCDPGSAPTGLPSDGPHYFQVDRYATTGVPVHNTAVSNFTIDSHAPVVTASLAVPPVNGFVPLKRPTFNYSATDLSLATVTCQIDSGPTSNCVGGSSFTPSTDLSEGAHSFTVNATDSLANAGASQTAVVNFTVDTIPPLITVLAPTPNQYIDASNPDISISVAGGTAQCKYDDNPYAPCDAAFASLTLPDGPHSLTVLATDLAGNTSTAFVLFTIDAFLGAPTTPPASGSEPRPKSAKFTAGKAKTGKSGATKRTISVALTLPNGVNAKSSCIGTAKLALSAKVGKKTKTIKKSLALKAKGAKCVVSGLFVLPQSFDGKRVKSKLSFVGNAFLGRFSFNGAFRN